VNNVTTITTKNKNYDVVIMGAGIAGLCQARHLLLKKKNLKIALIDPRGAERGDKDHKLGESTVEITSLFLCKELGLNDYMIENHPPKAGLNFHWPKQVDRTHNINDYYHVWINRQPPIPTFQINRPRFEQDLLEMNLQMGVDFYHGRVVDVDLNAGDMPHLVKVKCKDGQYLQLQAPHVVDAAGRKFIIGSKTDNLFLDAEELNGIENGAAWVRVRNIDRNIFHDGYDPECSTVSHYYATNHFFGKGHWIWMIPIDRDKHEISLGIIHHHDSIAAKEINTREKFDAFLKSNHTMLYDLINSGEQIDFHYFPRIAHKSKTLFSADNWYVLGDAAAIFDAFYSLGLTMVAVQIESTTELILAQLRGSSNLVETRELYNQFNLTYVDAINTFVKQHSRQIGNASIMSWRIYFEYMWWFGILVPMYLGKWHLDLDFIKGFIPPFRASCNGIISHVYDRLDILVNRGKNIGFLDPVRADQLIGHYYTFQHFDDFLENAKLEPQRCNMYGSMKHTFFYIALWYLKFSWTGFGIKGILNGKTVYYTAYLLSLTILSALGELQFKWKTRHLPANSAIAKTRAEFQKYQYSDRLEPWSTVTTNQSDRHSSENELLPLG
jgi:flavin-dependent dehydrogenase